MSRAIDEAYFKYSVYSAMESGMQVKCPKCQGLGMITADEDNVYFKCTSCNHQKRYDRTIYRYDIHNKCINCGRYYKVDIEDKTTLLCPTGIMSLLRNSNARESS